MPRGPALSVLLLVILTLVATFALAADHQSWQTRPIQLGVSGGNVDDTHRSYCCGGTLGALVTDGTSQYILSNNHVLAMFNDGRPGEPIVQPGLVDTQCQQVPANEVATLTSAIPIQQSTQAENRVDAGIALVSAGMVDPAGTILEIGSVSGTPAPAVVGLAVKKSGRSTGLTTSTVQAVGATVLVDFTRQCGGGNPKAIRFLDQVVFGGFSGTGDSGSLIVTDAASCPQPVALLFAGSPTQTFGNPITAVLSALGVSLVTGSCGAASAPAQEMDLATRHAVEVGRRAADRLLAVPGVVGVGGGADGGRPAVVVYLERDDAGARAMIPATLEDLPVRVMVSGRIVAR